MPTDRPKKRNAGLLPSTATPLPRPRVTDAVRLAAHRICNKVDCLYCPADSGYVGCCMSVELDKCARRILTAASVKLRGKP
jgi:hypothetical protein